MELERDGHLTSEPYGKQRRRRSVVWPIGVSDWLPNQGEHGAIRWRHDEDKSKRDWITPVTLEARQAIERMMQIRPAVGDVPIFRDPSKPNQSIAKHNAHRLLMRYEELAGVEHVPKRAWHGFRRRWADTMKPLSATDAAYLGGWAKAITLQRVYQRADEESMEQTLRERQRLLEAERRRRGNDQAQIDPEIDPTGDNAQSGNR